MSTIDDVRLLEQVAAGIDRRLQADTLADLDWQPRCQGDFHPRGLQGHVPAQPAAFYLLAPCHGPRIMVCAGRRAWLATRGTIRCTVCGVETLTERWKFEPIGGH